jgi:tetratricopeptide (TPR) repeat protein
MKFRTVAAAIVGIALLALVSYAQVASLEGTVIGLDGKPLQGAVIKLNRTDVKQSFQCKTDKKGHYLYMGLQSGSTFQVIVEVNGQVADTAEGVRVSMSNPKPVDFDLAKAAAAREARAKALQQAAESGKLTDDLTRGMSAADKEALEKQMKEQEGALKKNKERNEAFAAGMTALEAKQWDTAITSFEKAAEVDPNQVSIFANLGDAYFSRALTKRDAERDSDVQKGSDAYNKAIALKPTDAGIHNNFGGALARVKKYNEAQAEVNKAVELDAAGAAKYYYNLGAIYTNSGQSEQATAAFKKAIETDANYGDAYYQLGVSLMAQAKIGADGKIQPAPGTVEALQKCIDLVEKCTQIPAAKELMTSLGATIETQYKDPNRKSTAPAKKK